ncbi:AAA family ATPase [Loktanella sp. M215]|uniref:AAA family ATPase n=1 Tax=Loktanella sp. M215 TaxID=2675431 RepID=UPI001F21A7D9|nr:AAA family ATPase [Loktanella sp. M215]
MTNAQPTKARLSYFIKNGIDPKSLMRTCPPQEYVDGFLIPVGVCTVVAMKGSAGKTTAFVHAGINAAATGIMDLFGLRNHDKPQRMVLVLGEESPLMFNQRLSNVLPDGAFDRYITACESGMIEVVCYREAKRNMVTPDHMINAEAKLSDGGVELFDAIIELNPDIVVFDTLTSLCGANQTDDTMVYSVIDILDDFASKAKCAVILTSHLTKDGLKKIDETTTSDELIATMRGSAALVNASRHSIVMVPASKGMYENIKIDKGDSLWVCAVKSNIGHPKNGETFPVIRSKKRMTFVATAPDGKPIGEVMELEEAAMLRRLRPYVYHAVKIAAERGMPYAGRGQNGIVAQSDKIVKELLPEGSTSKMVSMLVDEMTGTLLTICRTNPKDIGVLDVIGGPYNENDPDTGKFRTYISGAPDVLGMAAFINEQVDMDPNGKNLGQHNLNGNAVQDPF